MYHALPVSLFGQSAPSPSSTAGSLIDAYLTSMKPVEEIQRELRGHRERFSTKVPRGIAAAARKNNPLYLSLDPSAGSRSKAMADKKKRAATKARRLKQRESEKAASGMEGIAKSMKKDQLRKAKQLNTSSSKSGPATKTQVNPPSTKKQHSATDALRRQHRRDRQHIIRSAKKARRVSQLLSWCPRQSDAQKVLTPTSASTDNITTRRDRRVRPTPVPERLRSALTAFSKDVRSLRKLYYEKACSSQTSTQVPVELSLPTIGLTVNLVEVRLRHRHIIKRKSNKHPKRVNHGSSTTTKQLSFTTLAENVVILFETHNALAGFTAGQFRSRRRQRTNAAEITTDSQELASTAPSSDPTTNVNASQVHDRNGIVVRARRHFPGSRGTRADLVHNLCKETPEHMNGLNHSHQFFEVQLGNGRFVL